MEDFYISDHNQDHILLQIRQEYKNLNNQPLHPPHVCPAYQEAYKDEVISDCVYSKPSKGYEVFFPNQ